MARDSLCPAVGSVGEGEAGMCDLVARTGRHLQRYENGRRLVAGCIPFRYMDINDGASDDGL